MAIIDDLVSYWSLDEATGTRADSHGSNDLTDNNTVGSADGIINDAADFIAANSEFLSHADNSDLSTGDIDFTIQGWVYLDSKASLTDIICKWGGSGDREYNLLYNAGLDRFQFFISTNGTIPVAVTADTFGSPSTGTWYLLHGWHDAGSDTLGISVNAGTEDTFSNLLGVFDSATPFRIGASPDDGRYFEGRVDEVGFWKRVLTSQDRTDLYNGGAGLAYPFSGGGSAGTFECVGQSAVDFRARRRVRSVFSSSGTGALSASARRRVRSVFSSAGASTASFVAIAGVGTFAASGTGTLAASARRRVRSVFSATGTSAVSPVARVRVESTFSAAGTSTASFEQLTPTQSEFHASGTGALSASARRRVRATFSATGVATTSFRARDGSIESTGGTKLLLGVGR